MTIILRPLINEKSTSLMKQDMYSFEVSKSATKKQIEQIVRSKFKVDVLSVKTINIPGKVKMQRQKRAYYTLPGTRKAIVSVKKGQKIALFEQVMSEPEEAKVTTAEDGVMKTDESKSVKEKKSLFGGTKVKVEKDTAKKEEK